MVSFLYYFFEVNVMRKMIRWIKQYGWYVAISILVGILGIMFCLFIWHQINLDTLAEWKSFIISAILCLLFSYLILYFVHWIYNEIKEYIRYYVVRFLEWILLALIIYMISNHLVDRFLSVLKDKATINWLSTIGTLAVAILALLPQLRNLKSSDLIFQARLEKTNNYEYRLKIKIINSLDRVEKIKLQYVPLYYFDNRPEHNRIYVDQKISGFNGEVQSFPAFGSKETIYHTDPIKIDFNKKLKSSIIVCYAEIYVPRDNNSYYSISIYAIKDDEIELKNSFETKYEFLIKDFLSDHNICI